MQKTLSVTKVDPLAGKRQVPAPNATEKQPPRELRTLGEYAILRPLGEGGMGVVYLGYCERLSQQVAIKVLPDELASNKVYVARFYREARNILFLNHPHIVRGLAVGQDDVTQKHYLVMEYVDGPSAHDLLMRLGRLEVGDAAHILRDVALALEHAHALNLVHRDIKPDNILLTQAGVAKLADLGLSKRLNDEASELTGTQQGFGTPYYMPYEQTLNARAADARSDLFALGATIYHLITGQVPFPGDNAVTIADRKNAGDFVPASKLDRSVPMAMDRILNRMMARHSEDRFQSASELLVAVERSRLVLAVPSFVDAEIALRDPQVRAQVLNPPQPTQLDPQQADRARGRGVADLDEMWHLRVRNKEGQVRQAKATTADIVQRLLNGSLDGTIEASRQLAGPYLPLLQYPEFRPRGNGPTPSSPSRPSLWRRLKGIFSPVQSRPERA